MNELKVGTENKLREEKGKAGEKEKIKSRKYVLKIPVHRSINNCYLKKVLPKIITPSQCSMISPDHFSNGVPLIASHSLRLWGVA